MQALLPNDAVLTHVPHASLTPWCVTNLLYAERLHGANLCSLQRTYRYRDAVAATWRKHKPSNGGGARGGRVCLCGLRGCVVKTMLEVVVQVVIYQG